MGMSAHAFARRFAAEQAPPFRPPDIRPAQRPDREFFRHSGRSRGIYNYIYIHQAPERVRVFYVAAQLFGLLWRHGHHQVGLKARCQVPFFLV